MSENLERLTPEQAHYTRLVITAASLALNAFDAARRGDMNLARVFHDSALRELEDIPQDSQEVRVADLRLTDNANVEEAWHGIAKYFVNEGEKQWLI